MNEAQLEFLALIGPPARLNVEQTALALNCQPHDIPTLVAARLLKPLGNPPASGVKFFSIAEVLQLAKNTAWLAKATNAIHRHWQQKNASKRPARNGDSD